MPAEVPMRVLVVEDHERMSDLIRRGLEENGYAVDLAATGEDVAVGRPASSAYDAVVLDAMLPARRTPASTMCRAAPRGRHAGLPVLMLTARDCGRRPGTPASTPAPTTTCRSRSRFEELLRPLCAR